MFNFAPILIGAAVGAGTSALMGSNPLKGAALGGLGGGLFGSGGLFGGLKGGVGNLINGIGTNAAAGGDVAKGLAMNASLLSGAQGLGAAGATNTAQTAAGLAEKGLTDMAPIQGFAGTPSGMSPMTAAIEQATMRDPSGFAGGITSLPASAAVPFGGSTGAQSLVNQGLLGSLKDYLPSSQAIGNLGLNLGSQALMRPPVQAPAGGITQGKPLDITAVENLLKGRQQAPSGLISDYFG